MSATKPTLRKQVFQILEITHQERRGIGFWINIFLMIVISLNAISIIIDTVPSITQTYHQLLLDFEVFSVVLFIIEYALRVWSCVEEPKQHHPIWGRLNYIFSVWGIIDLLSILPFFMSFFVTDLGFIRILRLLRMLRLFRVSRYFRALRVIQNVVKEKQEELVLSFVFIFFILIISSSLLYYVEHEAQPEAFSSIPASMWWGVNAMTTVGYGDIHPITPLGKLLAGIISIVGVALFALPTGILTSGFAEHINNSRKKNKCPNCGHELNHTHT